MTAIEYLFSLMAEGFNLLVAAIDKFIWFCNLDRDLDEQQEKDRDITRYKLMIIARTLIYLDVALTVIYVFCFVLN